MKLEATRSPHVTKLVGVNYEERISFSFVPFSRLSFLVVNFSKPLIDYNFYLHSHAHLLFNLIVSLVESSTILFNF